MSTNVSNARIIMSNIGWTVASAGLAVLSCAVLFIVADMSAVAKQSILTLPDMIGSGTFIPFVTAVSELNISLRGLGLVIVTFVIGFVIRMLGLKLTSNDLISSVENRLYRRDD